MNSFINGNDTLIIAFSGYAQQLGGIQPFEFLRYLSIHFSNCDRIFYKDSYCSNYHRGIEGISQNIDETIIHLKEVTKSYSKILFLGVSGGGYAAILFGSLLNVTNVLAFIPQTILRGQDKDPRYKDLKPFINSTTQYQLYGDRSVKNPKDCHHISHCIKIESCNVSVMRLKNVNLKVMRDSGELLKILFRIISPENTVPNREPL